MERLAVAAEDVRGFTLIELMLVASLLIVVLSAVLLFLDTTVKLAPRYQERGLRVNEAQVGLERMTRELRQASSLYVSPQVIEFDMPAQADPSAGDDEDDEDDDDDGDDGGPPEDRGSVRVRYDCSVETGEGVYECRRFEGSSSVACGSSLAATEVLATGVENAAVFAGAPSDAPGYVEVELALESEGSSAPIVLRDGVEPRNLQWRIPC